MATDLSHQEAFDRLVAALNEQKLGWIVEQVLGQVRLGKPGSRQVKELTSSIGSRDYNSIQTSFFIGEELRPGRRVKFRTTEPYSDAERLCLLVSAMRHALINSAQMSDIVTRHFKDATFASDEEPKTRFAVSELQSEQRGTQIESLRKALDDVAAQT